jgi:CO/xanthine dehydrogenase FAD-binding subunit
VITKYYRPSTLEEALPLAGRPDTVVLGGGTVGTAARSGSDLAVVDLQSLGLADIEATSDIVRIGAMSRLSDMVASPLLPDVLTDLARREAPNTIRNAATIAGTVGAADRESQLLAGLLAFGALVDVARVGSTTVHSLDAILDDADLLTGGVITAVSVAATGLAAVQRTGRTPMDTPIVSVVARRSPDGNLAVAIAGVADRPILVDPDRIGDLEPYSDFRGSSAYRSAIASILTNRVLAAISADGSS